MPSNTIHNVSDLSSDARSAIESILGHPLGNSDVLYIVALSSEIQPLVSERNAAWDELETMISDVHQHAAQSGLTPREIDDIIDLECAAVRYESDAANE